LKIVGFAVYMCAIKKVLTPAESLDNDRKRIRILSIWQVEHSRPYWVSIIQFE
jgi:hypothetical protein